VQSTRRATAALYPPAWTDPLYKWDQSRKEMDTLYDHGIDRYSCIGAAEVHV